MKEFEIYFSDLNKEAQTALLEYANISCPEDANWDVFPIATILSEEEEEKEEKEETHDYVLNTGTEFDDLSPEQAFATAEEAIEAAKIITQTEGKIAEVVYMPEDDIDTNEVIFRCSLMCGIEDLREVDEETYKKITDQHITEIIISAWHANIDEDKDFNEDTDEFYLWKSYIACFGYCEAEIDNYTARHEIECDNSDQDPDDPEGIPGSLCLTKQVIEKISDNNK